MAADACADFAVGNAFDFKGMQLAEGGDLIECQRRVLDQPDGCRFRHKRGVAHEILLDVLAAQVTRKRRRPAVRPRQIHTQDRR